MELDLNLSHLPDEILLRIFLKISSERDLSNLSMVCRTFHSISMEDLLWKEVCFGKFMACRKEDSKTWRNYFFERKKKKFRKIRN